MIRIKEININILILVLIFFGLQTLKSQDNVGIGTSSPHASAILDLTATNKGFLPPRLTTTQRDAISSPATGLIVYNTTNTRYEYYTGSTWAAIISNGITSVGITLPSELSVSGSPLVANGTISASWASQNQNLVFSSPNGSSGSPAFRALAAADIPNLPASKITSGTLPVGQGGTGAASLNGILKGNGTGTVTGITAVTNQLAYWTDSSTIGGSSKLIWNNSTSLLTVDGTIRFNPQGSAPGSPASGMTYYNTNDNKLYLRNDTGWVNLAETGSGGSLPSGTTDYTLRYGTSSWESSSLLRNTASKIAIGISSFTPAALIHSDSGNAIAHYHKFTAGTTTGQTATDGFDLGINSSGHGIINQNENLPVIFNVNNNERLRIKEGDGGLTVTMSAAGSNGINLNNTGGGGASMYLWTTNTQTGTNSGDGFKVGILADGTAQLRQQEDKNLSFFTNNNERLTINNSGPVVVQTALVFNDEDESQAGFSAANRSYVKLSAQGSISISNGVVGQVLVIQKTGAGNATITDGTGYKLTGNWVGDADDTITLIFDGTDWVEISRSLN